MDDRTFSEMALDELRALHRSVVSILASRLETRKRELEHRLRQLRADVAPNLVKEPSRRRYPAISPKFRNPAEPHQTWSGRGKRPHWVTELLNAGMSHQDFQIRERRHSRLERSTPKRPRGRSTEARSRLTRIGRNPVGSRGLVRANGSLGCSTEWPLLRGHR